MTVVQKLELWTLLLDVFGHVPIEMHHAMYVVELCCGNLYWEGVAYNPPYQSILVFLITALNKTVVTSPSGKNLLGILASRQCLV